MGKIFRWFVNLFRVFIKTVISLFRVFPVLRQPSYYPEFKRKSLLARYFDNIRWVLRYHEVNVFYNLYGLDVKGAPRLFRDYQDYLEFRNTRERMREKAPYSVAILRNKYIFSCVMADQGLPIPVFLERVEIRDNSEELVSKYAAQDVFFKSIDGECADGVYHVSPRHADISIPNGTYIVQRRVSQSKEVSRLFPDSINTVRIVTSCIDGRIDVLASGLRIGTSRTGNVDNWARGGALCSN